MCRRSSICSEWFQYCPSLWPVLGTGLPVTQESVQCQASRADPLCIQNADTTRSERRPTVHSECGRSVDFRCTRTLFRA